MNAPVSISDRLSATGTTNALELRGVSKFFGALGALEGIELTVRPGERRAVLGSNGAGKTTLFNCVTGDFLPTSGTIRFFGEDITEFPPQERIRRGLRRTYQISLLSFCSDMGLRYHYHRQFQGSMPLPWRVKPRRTLAAGRGSRQCTSDGLLKHAIAPRTAVNL